MEIARRFPSRHVGQRHRAVAAYDLSANPAAFLQIGFPGQYPPHEQVPRYAEPYRERELPVGEVSLDDL